MARFEKGRSGNPSGRKKNSPDKRSAWRRELAEHLPDILARVVTLAKEGDLEAIRIVLARTCPPLRPSHEAVAVDGIGPDATPHEIALAIARAAAAGRLPADVASDLASVLTSVLKLRGNDDDAADLEPVKVVRHVVDATERPFPDRTPEDHE